MTPYRLTYNQLLLDLHQAYHDACRHKRNKRYVQRFSCHVESNLRALCDELWNRTYQAKSSSCFIITDPKKREVFAADFRDRIVHHLYYNYTHVLYERTFIYDSYSCISGRGTHFGIHRLEHHIRQASHNYQEPCYVLKMDIRGYFMHIQRDRLLALCLTTLDNMASHRVLRRVDKRWQEVIDMAFVRYLTREIVLLNPVESCVLLGNKSDWADLPNNKSLFYSPANCGLPIGNLTSQLFSNIYLNKLDQFMKRDLKCQHYGRYVDDFFVVSVDKKWLHTVVATVREMLHNQLGLILHEGKVQIAKVTQGIDFLGTRLRPYHQEMSACKWKHVQTKMRWSLQLPIENAFVSYAGLLCHGNNYYKLNKLIQQ